jgi:hypothetical protein
MPSAEVGVTFAQEPVAPGKHGAPKRIPIATRPEGPIQLLSNAYLRKKETATIKARMPISVEPATGD